MSIHSTSNAKNIIKIDIENGTYKSGRRFPVNSAHRGALEPLMAGSELRST